MKVFISADLEGIAGVVSWDQTLRDGMGYKQACQWMTDEVILLCEVATEFNATRIMVADSHLTRQNIDVDRLPAHVEIVQAGPRAYGMMHGIHTDQFDIALCLGYHTGAHEEGLLNHTCNGAGFHEVRINGKPADELDIYAPLAGHFGAPVGLITGDDAICQSAIKRYPHLEAVSVKTATGRMSAICLPRDDAVEKLRAGTRAALQKASTLPVTKLEGPIDFEIEFKWHHPAETLSLLPQFERRGASAIGFTANDITEIAKAIEFFGSYKLVPYP
ncbi:MAG: M55 family metallopeptidase [Pseudomonadota bacterium]